MKRVRRAGIFEIIRHSPHLGREVVVCIRKEMSGLKKNNPLRTISVSGIVTSCTEMGIILCRGKDEEQVIEYKDIHKVMQAAES